METVTTVPINGRETQFGGSGYGTEHSRLLRLALATSWQSLPPSCGVLHRVLAVLSLEP